METMQRQPPIESHFFDLEHQSIPRILQPLQQKLLLTRQLRMIERNQRQQKMGKKKKMCSSVGTMKAEKQHFDD
eukprot:5244654-Ditylum_brightwellii.AAC.1